MMQDQYKKMLAERDACRYPNFITFAWQRSDGDYEIVGTLNGEMFDDDNLWNYLVRHTLATMQLNDPDTQAYHREDVCSVIENENGEEWEPINMANDFDKLSRKPNENINS